jgi:hypothetical protein
LQQKVVTNSTKHEAANKSADMSHGALIAMSLFVLVSFLVTVPSLVSARRYDATIPDWEAVSEEATAAAKAMAGSRPNLIYIMVRTQTHITSMHNIQGMPGGFEML